jgi:hypothetical protein
MNTGFYKLSASAASRGHKGLLCVYNGAYWRPDDPVHEVKVITETVRSAYEKGIIEPCPAPASQISNLKSEIAEDLPLLSFERVEGDIVVSFLEARLLRRNKKSFTVIQDGQPVSLATKAGWRIAEPSPASAPAVAAALPSSPTTQPSL